MIINFLQITFDANASYFTLPFRGDQNILILQWIWKELYAFCLLVYQSKALGRFHLKYTQWIICHFHTKKPNKKQKQKTTSNSYLAGNHFINIRWNNACFEEEEKHESMVKMSEVYTLSWMISTHKTWFKIHQNLRKYWVCVF